MKTLTCDLCDYKVSANSFEEWMEQLKPHYGQVHSDVMQKNMNLSDTEKKNQMMKWMVDNKKRFDAA